jgi:hypothetical protein
VRSHHDSNPDGQGALCDALWRASASSALLPVKVLADGTCLAELKPRRRGGGPPLTVRVIAADLALRDTGCSPVSVSRCTRHPKPTDGTLGCADVDRAAVVLV